MAVFGPSGFDRPESLDHLLGEHQELTSWLAAEGERLDKDTAGLALVDSHIDDWKVAPSISPRLINEVGLFFGSVLVTELHGAEWTVWPNGHPVVSIGPGRQVDAIEVVRERVQRGTPGLVSALNDLRGG